MDPPAPADRSAGPTRGLQAKTRKPIGSLGHALNFVSIGKLGNVLDFRTMGNLGNVIHFVTIGNLGNCFAIAKIANVFGWENALGGGEGEKPKIIGNIGKIVMPEKLA